MVTEVNLRKDNKEFGNARPQRSMDAKKLTLTAEATTGWIDKEFLAVVTLHAMATHAAITATVQGRFKNANVPDAATEHLIANSDGTDLILDMAQNAGGATFNLDQAAGCDQIKVDFSGVVTGDFVLSFAA